MVTESIDDMVTEGTDAARSVSRRTSDVGSWWDVLLLASVPALLVAVFALPREVRWRLAFEYADPTVTTAFASHFVHLSTMHLLVNLLGLLLVAPTAYLLSVLSDRRQQFLAAFVTFVVAFPFALSGLNLVFARPTVGVGFSGIVLAFVGYLGVVVMDFAGEWYDAPVDGRQSAWLFFLAAALIAMDITRYGPLVALFALLASGLFLRDLVPAPDREWLTRVVTADGSELAAFGVVVFLVYPAISITATPNTSNGIVNVYTHLLGFCLGYLVTYSMVVFQRED